MALSRRIVAEVLGTAFLLVAVVGSGIMGERLAGGNTAIALLVAGCALAFFQSERGGVFTDLMTTKFDGVRDEETRFNSLHR